MLVSFSVKPVSLSRELMSEHHCCIQCTTRSLVCTTTLPSNRSQWMDKPQDRRFFQIPHSQHIQSVSSCWFHTGRSHLCKTRSCIPMHSHSHPTSQCSNIKTAFWSRYISVSGAFSLHSHQSSPPLFAAGEMRDSCSQFFQIQLHNA